MGLQKMTQDSAAGLHAEGNDTFTAVYGDGRKYRYQLTSTWQPKKPSACFINLCPEEDLPTELNSCVTLAKNWGFGEAVIVNLFALVPFPGISLYKEFDPVGRNNDTTILAAARQSSMVLCGWRAHENFMGRARYVRTFLARAGIQLMVAGTSPDGSPIHPGSTLSRSAQPIPWIEENGH
jgi:hypothetical protein